MYPDPEYWKAAQYLVLALQNFSLQIITLQKRSKNRYIWKKKKKLLSIRPIRRDCYQMLNMRLEQVMSQ